MTPTRWRSALSVAGAAVGVAAAGGATALAVRRRRALPARHGPDEDSALGALRGRVIPITTTDGLRLHCEVDDAEADADPDAPTIVFVHGWVLTLDCWHYQRAALRGSHRLVLYDQRSHGRSEASDPDDCTADQLGLDLAEVIEQVVPSGPIVLVGHSMGGMTIMAYAQTFPERVRERVIGVCLLSSSAGDLGTFLGVRTAAVTAFGAPLVGLTRRTPRLLERSRRLTADLAYEAVRRFGFGDDPLAEHVAFTDSMIAACRTSVFLDFWQMIVSLDMFDVLVAFQGLPTVIVVGTKDAVTPVRHSRRMAELLPQAELVVYPGAGHMLMLEQHRQLNEALARLLERAAESVEQAS